MVFPTLVSPRTSSSSLCSFLGLSCSTSSTWVPFASRVFLECVPHPIDPHPHHHARRTPASIVCHTTHPHGAKPRVRHVDATPTLPPSCLGRSLEVASLGFFLSRGVCLPPLLIQGWGRGRRRHPRVGERGWVLGRRMRHDVVPKHGATASEAWNETKGGEGRVDRRAWG